MGVRILKGSAITVRPDKRTTVERDNLKPKKGEIIFNDDIGDNEYWNGSYWVSIGNYIIPTQLTSGQKGQQLIYLNQLIKTQI